MQPPRIGVLLTSYKRPHTLRPQLEALRAQTVQFKELIVWHNSGSDDPDVTDVPEYCFVDGKRPPNEDYIETFGNYGVWGRFFAAQLLDCDYVCVIDDDQLPGPRWFENCLNTLMTVGPAILGPCGVGYLGDNRDERSYIGPGQSDAIAIVDHLCHSWMFPYDLLRDITAAPRWREHPHCGEDMYVSVAGQRRGLTTYVPAQPPHDNMWWGNVDSQLGADDHALYLQDEATQIKKDVFDLWHSLGWKTGALNNEQRAFEGIRAPWTVKDEA